MAEEQPQEQSLEYQLPVELANGVYSNFALVHHETEHEITIDFCQLDRLPPGQGGPGIARVVSRVHVARSFVTPLLQAISANAFRQDDSLKRFEEGGQGEPSDNA